MVDGNLKVHLRPMILGKLLGKENRTAELADYCRQTLAEAGKIAEKIPEDNKTRVYYASGPNGMMTIWLETSILK